MERVGGEEEESTLVVPVARVIEVIELHSSLGLLLFHLWSIWSAREPNAIEISANQESAASSVASQITPFPATANQKSLPALTPASSRDTVKRIFLGISSGAVSDEISTAPYRPWTLNLYRYV